MPRTLLLCLALHLKKAINGYGSFYVVTFNFLKSIQILILPFFLGTTTMGDNHVASSID
jgi:hypothetical protein